MSRTEIVRFTLAFYPKAFYERTAAGLLTCSLLRRLPVLKQTVAECLQNYIRTYSSGNCSRFSRDSLLIPEIREPLGRTNVFKMASRQENRNENVSTAYIPEHQVFFMGLKGFLVFQDSPTFSKKYLSTRSLMRRVDLCFSLTKSLK